MNIGKMVRKNMDVYVGTSGWSNPIWNPSDLGWYAGNSELNAIELDMSFYQLPKPEQVQTWAKQGNNLSWTVKVNRAITHFFRFNDIALEKFHEFRNLFSPLDDQIAYYLFQLPPNAHPAMRESIESFYKKSKLESRFALEWRNQKWFSSENITWAKNLGITIVSADYPSVPRDIINSADTVYLRLHGRSDWFDHHYSRKELERIASKVRDTGCKRVFAFLNNNASQLKNARALLASLTQQNDQ